MDTAPRFIIRVSALSVMLAVGAAAQGGSPLAPGTRVRVTDQDASRAQHIGQVITTKGDSAVVEWEGDMVYSNVRRPTTLPPVRRVVHVSALEISRGFNTSGWRGMGYGAVWGLGIGAVLGYALGADYAPLEGAVAVGSLGLVAGTVIGGFAGSIRRKELWVQAPSWSGAGGSLTPTFSRRGAGFNVKLTF
jgi:hypothetical protein